MGSGGPREPPLPAPMRPCSFDTGEMRARLVSRLEHLERSVTMGDDGLVIYHFGANGTGVILRVSCAENLFIVRADYVGVYPLLKASLAPDDQIRLYEELLRLARAGIFFELLPNKVLAARIMVPTSARKGDYDSYDLAVSAILYLLGVLAWFSYILGHGSVEDAGGPISLFADVGGGEVVEGMVDRV